jgi:hypothetical protein
MARFAFSALMVIFFGVLAANTFFRFNEALHNGPLNILQGIVDVVLTSWMGSSLSALALLTLALVIPLFAARRSFEPRAEIAMKGAPAAWLLGRIGTLGWIVLIAGSVPALLTGYDYFTGIPTNATVIGVEMRCTVKRCEDCKTQDLPCGRIDQGPAGTFVLVYRTPFAKLRFQTRDGRQIETEAAFPRLGLKEPILAGQSIHLRYRAGHPAYASSAKLSNGFQIGIQMMLCGIVLIVVNRYLRARIWKRIRLL